MKKPSEHTLDSLWGHEPIKELIRSMIVRKRLPHAFLLHGPDAVGKRSLAFSIAKQILSSGRPPAEQSIQSPSAEYNFTIPKTFHRPDDFFGDDMFGEEVDMFGSDDSDENQKPESKKREPETEQEVEVTEAQSSSATEPWAEEEPPADGSMFGDVLDESPSRNIITRDDDYEPHLQLHPRVDDQVSRSYPVEYDGDTQLPAKCIDLNIIEPAGKSRSIKVDQVRYLQEAAWVPPMEGRYRVILVFGADTITASAANSLLKFLEEPPSFLILILVTNHYHKVIDTIRSRCASLFCQPMQLTQLADRLHEEEGVESGLSKIAAAFAEGRVGQALNSLSGKALAQRQEIFDARLAIERVGLHTLPNAVQRCLNSSEKMSEAILVLLSLVRDRLVSQVSPNQKELIVNRDFMDQTGDLEKDLDSLLSEANRLIEIMEMEEHPAVPAPQLPLELALWPKDSSS